MCMRARERIGDTEDPLDGVVSADKRMVWALIRNQPGASCRFSINHKIKLIGVTNSGAVFYLISSKLELGFLRYSM